MRIGRALFAPQLANHPVVFIIQVSRVRGFFLILLGFSIFPVASDLNFEYFVILSISPLLLSKTQMVHLVHYQHRQVANPPSIISSCFTAIHKSLIHSQTLYHHTVVIPHQWTITMLWRRQALYRHANQLPLYPMAKHSPICIRRPIPTNYPIHYAINTRQMEQFQMRLHWMIHCHRYHWNHNHIQQLLRCIMSIPLMLMAELTNRNIFPITAVFICIIKVLHRPDGIRHQHKHLNRLFFGFRQLEMKFCEFLQIIL